jgi:hypothetical protein
MMRAWAKQAMFSSKCWCSGKIDTTGDTILEIVRVLKTMDPEAAEAFVSRYISSELDE